MTPAPASSVKAFFLIRLAMAVGVITFIAVAWFLQGRSEIPARTVSSLTTLTTAMYTAVGIAAAVIMALRLRIASAEPAMRRSLSVVAWAVGEFAALFGGVMLFLTGDLRLVLPGALVFALALAAVRIPE
ncbi:MAG: hypothetical protein Q8K55_01700 [Gemmatimonadaceae bacterium]|nr:hypothetical protein [Gemmatimonadaceae bacterium]